MWSPPVKNRSCRRSRPRSCAATGGDLGDVPRHLDRLTGADVADLRQLYWTRAEAVVGEPLGEKVFVDKLPLHIVDLGLINVIFPDAKILVALRDPRDVCLSCLMQWFRLNIAMVHFLSLADTAAFYADVMGFWQAIRGRLTLRSMEVRYEDTVTDLPGQARRILDLLGVDWNDSVLSFHEQAAGRSIFTPSYTTVTEKVHTRAIGRWRNYERHFEPVREILAPYVAAFGYS